MYVNQKYFLQCDDLKFGITDLLVVSLDNETPVVPEDTDSMVPPLLDLYVLGDVRASTLPNNRKFMHLIATGWMMSQGTNCPPAVTSTDSKKSLKIPQG